MTQLGKVVGTLPYMAPEQLRGERAHTRSDIWALGVLLYEMASGQLPFGGDTAADVFSAIVKESPTPLPRKVSRGLRSVIQHCLTKEPARRYPHASAIQAALETIQSDKTLTQPAGIASTRGTQRRRVAAVAVGLVLVVGVLGYFVSSPTLPASRPRLANPVQLTTFIDAEEVVSWSPDSRQLVFTSNESGNWDVWVTQVGTGQPVNRTAQHLGLDRDPSWSPDGNEIAFWSIRGEGPLGIFVMSALGGPARQVVAPENPVPGPPQWSSDGRQLAYLVFDELTGDTLLEITTLETGEAQRYGLPGPWQFRAGLRWSPDGRYFAYMALLGMPTEITQLWVLRLADQQASAVTEGLTDDFWPRWSPDSQSLHYVSNRGGSHDLWRLDLDDTGVPKGPPEPVTSGVGLQEAVFSPDGRKLAYMKGRWISNIWRVPILSDRTATWLDAEQLTFDQAFIESVDVSPDGTQLLFSSNRAGNQDLWMVPVAGGELQQLTTHPTPDWFPQLSPDGQHIAFYAYRSGNRDIWVMPRVGGPARQLTDTSERELHPTWSPDGREIAFSANRNGNSDIWVIDTESGEQRRATQHPAVESRPVWSPDGEWLVFTSTRAGEPRLWRAPAQGGTPVPLTKGRGGLPQWSPDGDRVYFWRRGDERLVGGVALFDTHAWVISIADGTERQVTDLVGKRGRLLPEASATDGDYLYFGFEENFGDLWVMDVVQDDGSDD